MDIERVMTALRRRRWGILLAVVGCTGLTALGSTRMKREYQASATLMPQEQALSTTTELAKPEAGERDDLTGRQDRLKTVSSVLQSPAVLGTVIQQLHLPTTPAKLQESLDVKEMTSQVLKVSVKDPDPARAQATVNGIVDTFVRFYTDLRSREARKQVDVLERERASANQELVNASARLETFKRSRNISSLPDQTHTALESKRTLDETRSTAEAQLRDVAAQLASVQQVLARTPATREIREQSTQTLLLDKLRADVADLRTQLAKETAVHTDEHPNVQRLRQQLADAESRLQTESSRMSTSVKVVPNADRDALLTRQRDLLNQRDGLMARLASLNQQQQQVSGQVNRFSGADVELNLLTQRYTTAETRLNGVLTRLAQVRGVADLLANGSPIAVVDRAGAHNPAVDLSRGRTIRLSALAFALSLVMCMALAIGLEMADRRVRSVEDAESLMHLPVVSVVPQLPGRASAGTLCLTAENDPASHLAEAYHFLANHILRQTLRRESTVLMGATARPGQGATTALSNLAIALARAGRQVVLVEADLRRPFLHEVFGSEQKPGLTDVLQGRLPVRDALLDTQVERLRLLAGGSTVADPWSLLWQPSMGAAIQELRELADYVIFNVPSATVFADAMCVAPHVDGAVLVMRTSEMPSGAEQKVREWLEEVQVPVMGVVLNGVPARDMESFDFHRSYNVRRADTSAPALVPPAAPPVRRAA